MKESINLKDKPLVSFVLFSYNQSSYIKEALEGALSQTYAPLEIIISDDHSTDNTFEIITDITQKYDGPHKIILNRNANNLGVAEHVNEIVRKASGEILILAAGDDISLSTRVEVSVRELLGPGRNNVAFFSNVENINSKSEVLGMRFDSRPEFASSLSDLVSGKACWSIGASFAAKKEIFTSFPRLPKEILQEDGCNSFRALLLGSIQYVHEPLVKHRYHTASISQHDSAVKRLVLQRNEYFIHLSNYTDALSFGVKEKKILRYLEVKKYIAFVQHLFFKLPFIGVAYNFTRINLGKFKRFFK